MVVVVVVVVVVVEVVDVVVVDVSERSIVNDMILKICKHVVAYILGGSM